MALVKGTRLDPGTVNPRRRRRKEEEERSATAEGRGGIRLVSPGKGVSSAYFGKTGALPSPTRFVAFTAAAQKAGLREPEDFADLFPDWLPIEKADDDIDPASDLVDRVHGFFTNRLDVRPAPTARTADDIARSVAARARLDEESAELDRQQERIDRPDAAEREEIWREGEERTERDELPEAGPETQRVVREIRTERLDEETAGERAAGFFYADATPDLAAIRRFARRTGQDNGTIMDPATFMRLRSRFMGKERDELSDGELSDLDALARHFAGAYGDEFSERYAWRLENVTWDKHFDQMFSRHIIFANLPYLIYDAIDNGEAKRAASTTNINLAVGYDALLPDESVRNALALLGSLGDEDAPLSAQDQLTNLLYEGWVTAYNPYLAGDRAMFAFAHEFGPEALPRDKQEEWLQKRAPWEPHIEAMAKRKEAAKRLGLDEEGEGQAAFIESMVGALEDPESIVVTPRQLGPRGVRRETFSATDAFIEAEVAPSVDALLAVFDFIDREKQRLGLTLALMAERVGGVTVGPGHLPGVYEPDVPGVTERLDAARRQYAFALTVPTGLGAFDASAWAESWKQATKETSDPAGGVGYAAYNFREMGLDPEENKTLLAVSTFWHSIGIDLALDAVLFKGAKTAVKLGVAPAARAIMAPRARVRLDAAEQALDLAAKPLRGAGEAQRMAKSEHALDYAERLRNAAATAKRQGKADVAERMSTRSGEIIAYARAAKKAQDAAAPVWYTPLAEGLAQGVQRGDQVQRILSIRTAGISDLRLRRDIHDVTDRIAASRDANEIYDLLVWLKGGQAMQNIDPGALWLGRVARYKRVMFVDRAAYWSLDPTGGGARIANGLEDAAHSIEKFGYQWNMGLPTARRAAAAKRREWYIQESWRIDGMITDEAIAAEELLAKTKVRGGRGAQLATAAVRKAGDVGGRGVIEQRQWKLWQQFSEEVTKNLDENAATAQQKNAVRRAAAQQGEELPDGWDKSMLTVFNQYQFLTSGRAKKLQRRAGDEKRFYDELAEEAGEDHAELIGQMAKDIILPFQPQKLSAFMGNVPGWELFQARPIIPIPFSSRRFGPSITRLTGIFRTLVLAHLGFGINVSLGDELMRPHTLRAIGKGVLQPGRTKEMLGLAREGGQLRRVTADNISDIMRTSDNWVPMTPDDPDYPAFLNAHLKGLRGEQLSEWMLALPRVAGESTDDYLLRLRAHIEKELLADTDAAATLRLQLASEGRDLRAPYRTPGKLDAEKAQHARQTQDVFDDLAEIATEREALRAEAAALRKRTGRLTTKPSKRFTAAWLRAQHPDDATTAAGRALTDDELLSAFRHEWTPKGEKRGQLVSAWKRAQARSRGAEDEYRQLLQVEGRIAELSERGRELRRHQQRLWKAGPPKLEPGSSLSGWLDRGVERMRVLLEDDELFAAFTSGADLSKKQVRRIAQRLDEKKLHLPEVRAVQSGLKYDESYIPIVSETIGRLSHAILDRIGNGLNTIVFLEYFGKHYDQLILSGVSKSDAVARAGAMAEETVNRLLYRHAASTAEYALRNMFLFLPAYRQFAVYWGGLALRHPLTAANVKQAAGASPTTLNVGDYRMTLPKPFWAQGDLAEVGVPGAGPVVLAPLRMANTATGWSQTEDGSYTYTGNTRLDFLGEKIPLLSFMNKNTSPLAWVDDFFWGVAGEGMYLAGDGLDADNRLMTLLLSAHMSLFRDPVKRKTFAMNIFDAQVSRGLKPDFKGAMAEVRKEPLWWGPLARVVANPEGILNAVSRQIFIKRVQYRPQDIGTEKQDLSVLDALFSGDEVRSIADAEFAYLQAYPDQKKMDEVLNANPPYRKIVEFYDMNASEREEFFTDDDNLWMLPYVNRRNNYTQDGQLLVASDYWNARKEGQIFQRSMDEYREGWNKLAANAGWSRSLKTLETDLRAGRRKAAKFAREAIKKYAVTAEQAERWRTNYKFFAMEWSKDMAGTRYEQGRPEIPWWLVRAARDAGIEGKPELWDVRFLQKRFDGMVQLAEARTVGPGLGLRPPGAEREGLEGYWSDSGVQNRDEYDATVGATLRIVDALKKYASPDYKALFDPKRSISAADLTERLARDAEYNRRRVVDIAGQEFWKLSNPADALASTGAKIYDPDGLNQAASEIDALYHRYKERIKGVKEMSDEYKAIRAWHISERDKVLARPAAAPLRDGPAGRLLQTFIARPAKGRVNVNYVRHVVAVMGRDNPDYARLVAEWSDRYWDRNAPVVGAERAVSAAAWASILAVAVDYRRKMARQWNETMRARGVSPAARAAEPYVYKLTEYVRVWERSSDRFRREWKQLGGYDLIEQFLSTGY